MILPDDTPESPTKSRAGPPSEEPEEEEHALPPPAYPGPPLNGQFPSSQLPNVDLEAQASTSRTPLLQPTPAYHVEAVERAPARFLKAFGVAVLIYIVAASFTRTAIAGVYWSGHNTHRIPFPNSSDGKVEKCVTAAGARTVFSESIAMTSLLLPLSAKALYIFGRGELTHGDITFSPTYDPTIPDGNIRVDIIPHYHDELTLMATNICLLERAKGEKGIAILTPSRWYPSNDLSFSIDVRVPVAKGSVRVKTFESRLPMFKHIFSDELENKVTFGTLYVHTTNQKIHSGYLEADNVTIHTANAPITGVYRSSRALHLQTSNQPIQVDITLVNDDSPRHPTGLAMLTANAAIDAAISLRTPSPSANIGGAFSVYSRTQNGALGLRFHAQPADSILNLTAQNSNAPAKVHLHPAYEGEFSIGTSNGPTDFTVIENTRDPAGRGRKRRWAVVERTAAAFKGRVWWSYTQRGDGDESKGRASVQSYNSAVQVTV